MHLHTYVFSALVCCGWNRPKVQKCSWWKVRTVYVCVCSWEWKADTSRVLLIEMCVCSRIYVKSIRNSVDRKMGNLLLLLLLFFFGMCRLAVVIIMKLEFWLMIESWCSCQCVFITMELFCWVLVCVVYWPWVLTCSVVCCCVQLS